MSESGEPTYLNCEMTGGEEKGVNAYEVRAEN